MKTYIYKYNLKRSQDETMSEMKVRKLADNIRKNGFDYKLIERGDDWAIYSQSNGVGRVVAYEVFKIKLGNLRKAKERFAKLTNTEINAEDFEDLYEKFPSDEDFGKTAWTYPTLEMAKSCTRLAQSCDSDLSDDEV